MSKPALAQTYPIRVVARITGLSVDTLRAWERRYEVVVPERGRRGRVYSDSDIARLKQLVMLVQRGHTIGSVASLTTVELAGLIKGSEASGGARPETIAFDLTPLFQALGRYDWPTIERVLARHAAVLPTRDLVFGVVLPLLRDLGERWEAGQLNPAQEHLISAIVRSVLGGLLRVIGQAAASPTIVFATPAGERHELCLLCAALLAADAGWRPLYLGPDLPAADIAHAVRNTGARNAILGVTTPGVLTRSEVKNLRAALSDVEVWVGGLEAPSLCAAIGGASYINRLDDLVPMLSRSAP